MFWWFSVNIDWKCLKISPNKPGMLPDHSRRLLGVFWEKYVFIKIVISENKLFLQKSTSYGSSGRSAWGKMLVFWSSLFHVFTPTHHQYSIAREDFCILHFFSWKSDFSFRGFPELVLHRNTSTSRRGGRPQALFISKKWNLKNWKCQTTTENVVKCKKSAKYI